MDTTQNKVISENRQNQDPSGHSKSENWVQGSKRGMKGVAENINATDELCDELCPISHDQYMSRLVPHRSRIQGNWRPVTAFSNPRNFCTYTNRYDEPRRFQNLCRNVHDRGLTWRDSLRDEAGTNKGVAAQTGERAKAPWDNGKTVEDAELDDVKELPTLEHWTKIRKVLEVT